MSAEQQSVGTGRSILSAPVDAATYDRVDAVAENRSEFIREAIDAKLNGRETTGKRHTETYPIDLRLSEFETRMLANRLWELSEIYDDRGQDHHFQEMQIWSRRLMALCNTREDDE